MLRGLRGKLIHDLGAYAGSGAGQPGIIVSHMLSAYVLPAMHVEAVLVCLNGAGDGPLECGGELLRSHAFDFSSS